MANASSLNTLYSLINGPNADRIGGFIANAQVDDAARLREATRLADANLALGNKQTEYSLAAALSRSPETAAMFQPGREVLAPNMQDMAYSLTQQLPKMQNTKLRGEEADINYKFALADRARREPVGSQDKGITAYQKAQLDLQGRQLDQNGVERLDRLAEDVRAKAAADASRYLALAEKYSMINKPEAAQHKAQAQAILNQAEQRIEQLYTRRSSGKNTVGSAAGEGLVQPTAAPQAKAPTAPSNDERAIRVQQAKQHYARLANDPQGRAELLKRAASMGIMEKDLQ